MPAYYPDLNLISASAATVYNINLSTLPLKVPSPASNEFKQVCRYEITNGHSASYVAFALSTAASPAFVSSVAGIIAPTEGHRVFPLSAKSFVTFSDLPLWIVASAASTPVQVIQYNTAIHGSVS
jgi:hypothetical protein